VIHGLDMTDAIDEADRRGWVDKAYRGLFPELAPDLAGQYDVVSMHHYLEHVRDPAAELDAAATVLEPGGHLEIEVPNPESAVGRRLGRWWVANFQPQHQHLIPYGQLESMLRARGFTPVLVQFAEAHQPYDLLFAVYLGLNHLLPLGDVPWRDAPPSAATRLRRSALFAASGPVAAVAAGIDQAIKPVVKRWSSNTYRVVARYDGVPVAAVPPAPTTG
jgi:SAM-dependent methyltransferase